MADLKVLVVEDESTIRLTLSYVLRKAGYSVSTCSSFSEASKFVDVERFFLVLVDLVLGNKGKLEGLEIVQAIKSRNPETCVIVMTAYGSSEVKHKALAAGASSYWDKPLNLEKLLEEIHRLEPNESNSIL
jgi:DNA-binding NtrC family response regulator